eukprot:486695-Amorphochlora_amoeboformis.AAC.1
MRDRARCHVFLDIQKGYISISLFGYTLGSCRVHPGCTFGGKLRPIAIRAKNAARPPVRSTFDPSPLLGEAEKKRK